VPAGTVSAEAMVVLANEKPDANAAQLDRVAPVAAANWGAAGLESPPPPQAVSNKPAVADMTNAVWPMKGLDIRVSLLGWVAMVEPNPNREYIYESKIN
jgi:hypothetical protein